MQTICKSKVLCNYISSDSNLDLYKIDDLKKKTYSMKIIRVHIIVCFYCS